MPENKEEKKASNQIKRLNKIFKSTSDQISTNLYGSDNSLANNNDWFNKEIEKIIGIELSNTKSITSDDMSTFLVKLFNEIDNNAGTDNRTMGDIFENDNSGIFQFFQERYQNQNLLYEDLKMISTQLFELDEAILTTRDAIVTSDDISHTISRILKFNHINPETNEEYASYIKSVEELERKLKIPIKLKNQIIPNALTYGSYYAYVCPYSKMLQEEYDKKMKREMYTSSLSESIDGDFIKNIRDSIKTTLESNVNNGKTSLSDSATVLESKIKDYTKDISVINNYISIPLFEGTELSELTDNEKFAKSVKRTVDKTMKSADGTFDTSNNTKQSNTLFNDQTGCYIKFIDPRKLIPITILNTTIGYYYIHTTDFKINKSPFSSTIKVTNIQGLPSQQSEDVEMMFLSKITDKIVKAFDKPFLEKNAKFKDLILDALMYNDLYTKELTFQFIPAEYIVNFKINEDEDGNGKSILSKALFYAKLYLALLIFKMISIVTRSNDTRVYYVKNSGIDQSITNKVQEVARSIKGRQINFMDLLNYNSIISKIGAYKEIFIPVGRSGERGIEFDTLAGQDIPLNTDLMEMLRTNMINATGVPSVIMSYVNEADYAKTLVMANSKFAGRINSFQLDLNSSITDFYKLVIKYSNITIPEEILNDFEFAFNPPRTLNNINISDAISNADQIINAAIKAATGENADQSDVNNNIKDKMYNTLLRQFLPMIDWVAVDAAYKNAKLELSAVEADKKVDEVNKSKDSEDNF